MGETEEFNSLVFEKKLAQLKDTQECIQGMSAWCLKQREHHKKIVTSWLNVLKRVKIEQRLVLFYLANDVIQYSKRKNYDFVESWGFNLQKATPLVRDEKVRHKILRIFKIWEQRSVYDEEFLSDLTGLLSAGAVKKTDDESIDFQPQQLVNKIKQCTVLEADTDQRLKHIHESQLPLSDADALSASLKDRCNKEDVEKELNEGIACVERYTQALQREIVAREALLALLTSANQYYSTQRGEVKVVAYAYKNFGVRVRVLKRKLDSLIPRLSAAPSPPRRDEDVPSPAPDEDIDLPNNSYNIDKTFNTSLSADGSLYNLGLSSFLGSESALSMFNDAASPDKDGSTNKIEVLNSRLHDTQDFDINNFLKTLLPNDNNAGSDNISVSSATLSQKSQDALPGLDLLTPESSGNPPPPTSFYGSTLDNDDVEPYIPEQSTTWNINNLNWRLPPTSVPPPAPVPAPVSSPLVPPVPPPPAVPPPAVPLVPPVTVMHCAPPASPPPQRGMNRPPPVFNLQEPPPSLDRLSDVDHRGLLPPPPPPPLIPTLSILGQLEDVDHRLLPPPPPAAPPPRHGNLSKDVDHRNLISLTNQPPPIQLSQAERGLDQDYRVPPLIQPSDIVESVDMDLSEDEEQSQPRMYPSEHDRRNSFNQNNKVLVGGDNGKTNPNNLIRINSLPGGDRDFRDKMDGPSTAPIVPPLSNPFDNMPSGLKFDTLPPGFGFREDPIDDDVYEEDLRSRGLDTIPDRRNPSPPEEEWSRPTGRFMNQRFPRNWGPRTNFGPNFGPQFWPRNGPRPPRPYGPKPQRFW